MKRKYAFNLKSVALVLGLFFSLLFSGCDILKKIADIFIPGLDILDNTNSILDKAINNLSGNAANFSTILQEAIEDVKDAHVKDQLVEALNIATKNVSDELKCDIQFTGDFLIKKIRSIKAEYNDLPLPVQEPMICVIYPDAVNLALPPNLRNNITVSGYFFKENYDHFKLLYYESNGNFVDKTNHLSFSTDYKLKINLGNNGIVLNQNSSKLVLKLEDEVVSEIVIIQQQPEPCNTKTWTYTDLPNLVLYPVQKKDPRINKPMGDKEFSDHGPCTTGYVTIFTRNNGQELWARAFVRMWECPDDLSRSQRDYSYGDFSKEIKLATVETGYRILKINITTVDNFANIDKDWGIKSVPGGGPVSQYRILGDTDGEDLGASWIQISFRNISVTLIETGNCISN